MCIDSSHRSLRVRRRLFWWALSRGNKRAYYWLSWVPCLLLPPLGVLLWERIQPELSALEPVMAMCGLIAGAAIHLTLAGWLFRRGLSEAIAEECTSGRWPRCFGCGYRLEGSGGDTCPECGECICVERSVGRNGPCDPVRTQRPAGR